MNSRLASSASSYLKSAAHQPVDWHPWSPEAFARAKAESKPILLDIGAVWCHWCHVMDGESYEDPDVAADTMARQFDFRNGGFGNQPKFPHPGACEFLLARWFDRREDWAADIVRKTLVAMAKGGVYDQIGGGFHRYSTDARWVV